MAAGQAIHHLAGLPALGLLDQGQFEPPACAQRAPGGQRSLRVDIQQGDAVAQMLQRHAQMRHQRGLAGPALLLSHRDYLTRHGFLSLSP